MDQRFWEKVIAASVIAVGIAVAGYQVGGGQIVVVSERGVVFVVDRFSGAVRICVGGQETAECAVVQSAGTYPTFDEWQRQRSLSADAAAVPQ
jgi:hypothetical protein